jgi:hypothetical protein
MKRGVYYEFYTIAGVINLMATVEYVKYSFHLKHIKM